MSKLETVKVPKEYLEMPVEPTILHAFLQTGISWPGICMSETNLSKYPSIKYTQTLHGLVLQKGDQTAMVPWANVKFIIYK